MAKKLRVAALDLGSRLGWALPPEDGRRKGTTGEELLHPGRHQGNQFMALDSFLEDKWNSTKPWDAIAYENVFLPGVSGVQARRMLYGYAAVIDLYACWADIQVVMVHPLTLKKWATGKGDASKAAMKNAFQDKFGITTKSDNEADAALLQAYVEEKWPELQALAAQEGA